MSESPLIFDRKVLRARRPRARALGPATFLLERAAADLAERLAAVLRRFPFALDLGTPGDEVRAALAALNSTGTIVAANADCDGLHPPLFVAADEEALPFRDAAFDLVVSALSLQFVNDLPGAFVQIRRALRPDGLFLAVLMGGDTLTELRQSFAAAESEIEGVLSPRVSPFADLRDLGALLQRAGFALPVVDGDLIEVTYADPLALMRELRAMCEGNAVAERRKSFTRRATLARAAQHYRSLFARADGRIPATF